MRIVLRQQEKAKAHNKFPVIVKPTDLVIRTNRFYLRMKRTILMHLVKPNVLSPFSKRRLNELCCLLIGANIAISGDGMSIAPAVGVSCI
jgi:hypothetical protein